MPSRPKNNQNRGFTLVELLVTIVIFAFFTQIYVFQGRTAQSRLLNDDIAYKIALSIREVQSYGVSVKQYKSSFYYAGTFDVGYGVQFTAAFYPPWCTGSPCSEAYFVYADLPNGVTPPDRVYTPGVDVKLETINLKGAHVDQICFNGTSCGFTTAEISFLRPNPDAKITSGLSTTYTSVRIRILFSGNQYRYVTIHNTGQVKVSRTP